MESMTTESANNNTTPAEDRSWTAVPRSEATSEPFPAMNADQQIDWLLRAVTEAGADVSQRRYDLESLARIVTENPSAGYGKMPIDTDTHPSDCLICEGADDEAAFAADPPGRARDNHPYVTETQAVWVCSWVYWNGDEQGGGGFEWVPEDKRDELFTYYQGEAARWATTTARIRFLSMQVPVMGRDEITEWIDGDIDLIEASLPAEHATWTYSDDDGRLVLLAHVTRLKQEHGWDVTAEESAEIKAFMREHPHHAVTDELNKVWMAEWDELYDEQITLVPVPRKILRAIEAARPALDGDTMDADFAQWARTAILPALRACADDYDPHGQTKHRYYEEN